MKKELIKFLRILTLILLWALLSPFFLFLAAKWKVLGKKFRVFLFLFSPFMVVVYGFILISVFCGYSCYDRKYGYTDNRTIERITGVDFPDLKIIDYERGNVSFNGDYMDEFIIEMESELDESVYNTIDSLILLGNKHWSSSGDRYSFHILWGNGYPAPEGENDNDDKSFSLSVVKGGRTLNLKVGTW